MMSPETIRALNEQAAAEAAEKQRVPFVPDGPDDAERWPPFPFPNLGDHRPPGWEITDGSFFVDKTGLGRPTEVALTVERFRNLLRDYIAENPGHGFAITEEGPFQLVVSAMKKVH